MGTLAVNIALYKSLPYDSQKDLDPIGLGGTNPMVLVTKKDLPAKTFAEFVAYVKANQKKVQYGMAGIWRGLPSGRPDAEQHDERSRFWRFPTRARDRR